jgi:tetratricopeptide (TPR) repeat protein
LHRRPSLAHAAALVTAAQLAGCAQSELLRASWPDQAPPAVELTATPFHPQEAYQCGPAALATMLGAAGREADPDALVAEVYVPARKGSLQPELVAAARRRGLVVYPLRPALADLLAQLDAGHPVLVLQNLGAERLPVWHYAVVVGADTASDRMLLRSGTQRRREERASRFLKSWALADYWGVVTLVPGQLPADPDWSAYLKAVAALEQTGQYEAAAAAYQAAVVAAPDLAAARFGLANSFYRLGRIGRASEAFAALGSDPEFGVAALNNLASLYAERGCAGKALAAIEQAERQAGPGHPHGAALQATRAQAEALAAGAQNDNGDCPR